MALNVKSQTSRNPTAHEGKKGKYHTTVFQRTQILTAYHEAVLPTLILKETKRKTLWITPYLTLNKKKNETKY